MRDLHRTHYRDARCDRIACRVMHVAWRVMHDALGDLHRHTRATRHAQRATPIFRALSLAAATFLAACGSSTAPGPGKATTITISAGDAQSAGVGTALSAPLAVRVTDARGRGVPGQEVDFLVAGGGGTLAAPSATTNSNGVATDRWTLGTSITASQRVTAQLIDPATGALVASVEFHATPTAGPPANMFAVGGVFQSGFAGSALPDPLTVAVVDAYANPVPNVTVTFAVTAGGGSITPTTATTGANGRASATWVLGAYGQQQLATATAGVLGTVTFSATVQRPRDGTSVNLPSRPFGVAVSPNDVVYVTQLDAARVTRYNGTSTTAAAAISVGTGPVSVAFDPSGGHAYVANQLSQSVSVIATATNTVESTIPVTGDPFRVIVSPDASRLYVSTNANVVYAIDLATKTVVGQLGFTAAPNGLALSADGSRLYVSTYAAGTVVEVATSTMTSSRTYSVGGTAQEVQLSANGSELYAVSELGTLSIFSTSTGALLTTLDLNAPGGGAFGAGLTTAPDRTHLFVTFPFTGDVKVVDLNTRTVSRTLYVGGAPRRVAFTSDGTAVIANEAGYVTWVR